MPHQWTALILLLLTTSYCAQSAKLALDKPQGTSSQQPTSNISLAAFTDGEVPHTRLNPAFHATIVLGDVVLPFMCLLRLGVESLARLAWKDSVTYTAGSYMVLEDCRSVAIAVVPQNKDIGVSNGVAVRCILFGMHHVATYQEFKNATIDCFWVGRRVAWVLFETSRDGLSSGEDPTPSLTAKIFNTSLELPVQEACTARFRDNTTCVPATAWNDVNPYFFYHRNSREVPVLALFMTVMVALEDLSFLQSTAHLTSHRTIRTAWDTSLQFVANDKRLEPPFCDFGWLIETVRRIPSFMMQQNRFAEISIGIIVDGAFICDGLLEKGRPVQITKRQEGVQ